LRIAVEEEEQATRYKLLHACILHSPLYSTYLVTALNGSE